MDLKKLFESIFSDASGGDEFQTEKTVPKSSELIPDAADSDPIKQILSVSSGAGKTFFREDVDSFQDEFPGAIDRQRLNRALTRHREMIEQFLNLESDALGSLMDLGMRVNSSLDLDEVIAMIMDQAARVTRSEASRLFLVDRSAGHLEVYQPESWVDGEAVPERFDMGRGIAGWVAERDMLVIVPDVSRDSRYDREVDSTIGTDARSILAVPLKSRERCIGVLVAINKVDGSAFTEEDALLMSIFADQAATAIQNARIHGALEARLNEIVRTRKQLVEAEKFRALETLSAGVSHDFKNLLNAILGFAEIIFLDVEDDDIRKDVMEIINAATSAVNLVRQIQTFSRQQEQKKTLVGVNSLVRQTIKLFQASTPKVIDIRYRFKTNGEQVMADPSQIHQALMNLLQNAADAIADRGGVIRIDTNRVRVGETDAKAANLQPGDYVELIIRDNGKGMTQEQLEQMFEPYYTTKPRGVGTGLGLPTALGIIRSHQGDITAVSIPEQGTAMQILLPTVEAESRTEGTRYEGLPRGEERVMVVDDDRLMAMTVKKMLGHLGYQVTTVHSAEAALDLYRQQPHQSDLVITDWSLPGIRGDRLAEMMMNANPSARIIIYSAYGDDLDDDTLLAGGVRAVLRKPVDLSNLAVQVRTALDDAPARPSS